MAARRSSGPPAPLDVGFSPEIANEEEWGGRWPSGEYTLEEERQMRRYVWLGMVVALGCADPGRPLQLVPEESATMRDLAPQAETWQVHVIGGVGQGWTAAEAWAINDSGVVVGSFVPPAGVSHTGAWRWRNGVWNPLSIAGVSRGVVARGISTSGRIVGWRSHQCGTFSDDRPVCGDTAWVRSAAGADSLLPRYAPGSEGAYDVGLRIVGVGGGDSPVAWQHRVGKWRVGLHGAGWSNDEHLVAVNASSRAVGGWLTGNAFTLTPGGTYTQLDTAESCATDINDAGDAVGVRHLSGRVIRWSANGGVTDIGDGNVSCLGGPKLSNRGRVVYNRINSPYTWRNGVITPLPVPLGAQDMRVRNVNTCGVAVGSYRDSQTQSVYVVRWRRMVNGVHTCD